MPVGTKTHVSPAAEHLHFFDEQGKAIEAMTA
jgi:hypothetical protein